MAKKVSTEPETITRAITMAVAHPLPEGGWATFQAYLDVLWAETTAASNWCMREYARLDRECGEPGQKLPPCPPFPSFKDELQKRFTTCSASTLDGIQYSTKREYLRRRFRVWRGLESLVSYRYPAPFPVRKDRWIATLLDDQRPVVCFTTGLTTKRKLTTCEYCAKGYTGGGTRQHWSLVLRGGAPFARQLAQFRQVVNGEAKPCDLAIYRKRAGSTHRNGTEDRSPGGAPCVRYDVMLKIVAKFPRPAKVEGTSCLNLDTDRDAFWVARHDGRVIKPFVLNGDDLHRWLQRMRECHLDHAAKRQRISQDMKVERRTKVGPRESLAAKLNGMCEKHARRVSTFIKQCVAGIVNYCIRRKISVLIYNDTERGWMNSEVTFPWSRLRMELRSSCEAAGIVAGGVLIDCDEEEEKTEMDTE